jgi:hypothetical protein
MPDIADEKTLPTDPRKIDETKLHELRALYQERRACNAEVDAAGLRLQMAKNAMHDAEAAVQKRSEELRAELKLGPKDYIDLADGTIKMAAAK